MVCIGANKSDLEEKIAVTDDEVNELINGTNYLYYKTSAKIGLNIEEMFKNIAEECYKRSL